MAVPSQNATDSVLILPTAVITDGAEVTANLDTKGAGWATIRVIQSAEQGTNSTGTQIELKESDDTVVTNFATIIANQTFDNGASAGTTRFEVDLKGRKRYLRLEITASTVTNHGDVVPCAVATLSRLDNSEATAATIDVV
ncbi:MAG: hypothetical protein KJO36_03630 [Acidimicrobiia bacterium]|nr:hypothetical protein [Acidimicrobiia bacterium]